MADEVLRHLYTGFLRLHVLYHADCEEICGTEMMVELRSHGYRIGPGTLYPLLHDLEERGYLKAREVVVEGKRRRNLRITADGRRLLARARVKLRELTGEILNDGSQREVKIDSALEGT
jgi:DNA-binding PadR family transcriptional regulator